MLYLLLIQLQVVVHIVQAGTGVSVGLSNSQTGVNYQLKLAGINTGSPVAGTGSAIGFGIHTTGGNYTVEATNTSTSCVSNMTGSANININPLPTVSLAASTIDCFNSLLTATNSGGTMATVSGTNGTDFSISAFGTSTISSSITLPAGYLTAASNITVTMNIDHTGAGDLVATLISPSCGQTVLFNRPGGSGNGNDLVNTADYVFATSFGTTFPGSSGGEVPTGNYNASFSGLTYPCTNIAGTWTLQIQDMQFSRGGTLRSWSIAISNAGGYTTVFNGPASIGTTLNTNVLATATVTPPNGTNSYTAITTDANGCVSAPSNSVNVVIAPTFSLTSLPASQVSCVGQTATFDVVASGSGLSYQWRKGLSNLSNGGNIAGANSSTLTLSNLAAVDAANNYNVVVTDGSCTLTSPDVSLGVGTTLPATPVVTPTSAVLFPGDIQALTATNTASSTLGTGTSTNTTTGYPAVLGTYYGGARHQVLVLASELTTMGIVAGEAINSISFDVANTNNAHPMTNYTINIGNTALSALNATFVGGLSQVYYTASYTANNGLNLINFSSPFVWNGTSNIVIETVFNNNYLGTTTNPNCSIKYTTTAFTSVNYSREDNVGAG
ncbi:MAG: proprotein convertase P-domain-containing protein [Bacteroidetes bacterium]|nr:proprotein convertase P-domain-containing protein [Bacteroidota bacterium]